MGAGSRGRVTNSRGGLTARGMSVDQDDLIRRSRDRYREMMGESILFS